MYIPLLFDTFVIPEASITNYSCVWCLSEDPAVQLGMHPVRPDSVFLWITTYWLTDELTYELPLDFSKTWSPMKKFIGESAALFSPMNPLMNITCATDDNSKFPSANLWGAISYIVSWVCGFFIRRFYLNRCFPERRRSPTPRLNPYMGNAKIKKNTHYILYIFFKSYSINLLY